MPYWDHEEETQGIASPLCDSYNKGKCQVCLYDGPGFSLLCDPPPTHRLSEKSRREQKSLYPTTGATTDFQSSHGVLLLLRQSPPPQVSARVFSGRISGVCLQWCFQGASRVFAIDGNGHRPCKRLWHSQPFLT